ncbi:M23 family metallopeptidase [Bradyrhizobium sp.]|uniref:M23 family metallopeptidase n=1 Tax=Bradyrhizobium sp. TaxID=376 RepID=UPI00260910B6|nr:M23 family metallopeptidase [Bradyrhizobium sp.]
MSDTYDPGDKFKRVTSRYGWRTQPIIKQSEFHPGVDFGAPEGTPIPSAASGVVVYSGKNEGGYGNTVIVRNDIGDYSLYAHMRGDNQVKPGQRLWKGDTIGIVGNTGESTGPHLHYSVIAKEAGRIYDPTHPRTGGPIGLHPDQTNTYDPATYKNYVLPPPAYLDQSERASDIMSGGIATPASGAAPPDMPAQPFFSPFGNTRPSGPNPFADRFGKWGSVPLPDGSATSDDPGNFADRLGTWDLRAPGALGNIGAPAVEVTPDQGKRSEADDGPVRVLSRRADLSSSLPAGDAPPFSSASPPPLLGIFSGKPMPDWPVQPSIFQPKDQSSPDDNELFQRWMRWVDG